MTPLSQMVGNQAVTNVLMGERYKQISKEMKNYFKGEYGIAPPRQQGAAGEDPGRGRQALWTAASRTASAPARTSPLPRRPWAIWPEAKRM
ncbi:MAG: hypothetical protein V8S89_00735 [Oscillospiraceae bacterium]